MMGNGTINHFMTSQLWFFSSRSKQYVCTQGYGYICHYRGILQKVVSCSHVAVVLSDEAGKNIVPYWRSVQTLFHSIQFRETVKISSLLYWPMSLQLCFFLLVSFFFFLFLHKLIIIMYKVNLFYSAEDVRADTAEHYHLNLKWWPHCCSSTFLPFNASFRNTDLKEWLRKLWQF